MKHIKESHIKQTLLNNPELRELKIESRSGALITLQFTSFNLGENLTFSNLKFVGPQCLVKRMVRELEKGKFHISPKVCRKEIITHTPKPHATQRTLHTNKLGMRTVDHLIPGDAIAFAEDGEITLL